MSPSRHLLSSRIARRLQPPSLQVSCLDDACPHRGAPLSAGWLAKEKPDGAAAAAPKGKKAGGCSSSKQGSTCLVWWVALGAW